MSLRINGYKVVPLLKRTGREIMADRVPTLAAQTAYYFFFSLFPLLLFLAPMLSLVGDKERVMSQLYQRAATTLPPAALGAVWEAIKSVVLSDGAPGLMSAGALLAAWSGSNIFGALGDALNTAYDVKETRKFWKRALLRLGVFVFAALIMVLATVIVLAGEDITHWASARLGFSDTGRVIWTVVQFPIAFLLLVALAFVVYYFLPNVRQRWQHVFVAAVATTVLWLLATLLFRLYVQNFANFNKTYGTIGGIIALLSWMYYSMFVVLSGGELASELHHGTGALEPEKGAIYHGRIVSDEGPATSSLARVQRAK